jgi:hypothetical protein
MPKVFAVFFLSVMLGSCVFSPQIEFDEKEFIRQRILWETQGIENYMVVQDYIGTRPPSSRPLKANVIVENGIINRIEILDERDGVRDNPPDYSTGDYYPFKTVSELYEFLFDIYQVHRESIKEGDRKRATFEIWYNNQYHYPEGMQLNIRRLGIGNSAIDSTRMWTFKFSDFKVIEK